MDLPPVITSEGFRGLYARHGFTQAEKGSRDMFNEEMVNVLGQMTKQAMLQADHEKHSGLHRSHAQKAVEMTPEIPKGIY